MTEDQIAKVCYEVNRAYCQALGDNSQPEWKDAPEWQKESARQGVLFYLSHPDAGPETMHENWMNHKIANGWTHGLEKSAELKQHPCIVVFSLLPKEQQAKDFIFRAVVHALL